MKAAVYEKYGSPDVLQIQQVEKPTPKDNEILVKVYATSVTAGDTRMRAFRVPSGLEWIGARLYLGVLKPRRKILGMELAGEVEAVGQSVTRFKPGDQVFASTFQSNFGGYVEYKCLPEDTIVARKPANMTHEEAATVPIGGMTAAYMLQNADIQNAHHVLIYGASGSVGTFAVQIAKCFGAAVTGVCSTANLDMVKSIGADRVIDYTKEDVTQSGETYDIIFDTVGKFPRAHAKGLLKPDGRYISVASSPNKEKIETLLFLQEHIEAGHIQSVIDRRYPLEQIVEAHRYVDAGHKKGNVAVTVA